MLWRIIVSGGLFQREFDVVANDIEDAKSEAFRKAEEYWDDTRTTDTYDYQISSIWMKIR